MSYAVNETKELSRPAADVLATVRELLVQLGGKRPKKDPGEADQVQADFNKEVAGRAFANRVRVIVRVAGDTSRCTTSVEAYPVDPLGNRLQFGVVGEPARFVAGVIWERLEARLGPAPP
jgi:hypothetical protein